jgi:hypothetical protein
MKKMRQTGTMRAKWVFRLVGTTQSLFNQDKSKRTWIQICCFRAEPNCIASGLIFMTCPNDIAEILLDILRMGLLSIRASDDPVRSSLEADHLHNLPTLLSNYSPDLLKFYWEVERPSFLQRCTPDVIDMYTPLWNRLAEHLQSAMAG